MIYQNNNTFKVFQFVAEVDGGQYYLDDKDEFEKNLLFRIKMDKIYNNTYVEDEEIVLPPIVYSDFSLSSEQQIRFDEITKSSSTLSIDDVSNYVFNGITNNVEFNLNLKINNLKEKNTVLETENASLKIDMANILMYISNI